MALSSLANTEALSAPSPSSDVVLDYLDSLYREQILPAAVRDGMTAEETDATWEDWRRRLRHPSFGLSTFFITQNGAAKCGIRLGPTIESLAGVKGGRPLAVSMAFAVAAILRFLTPVSGANGRATGMSRQVDDAKRRGVYLGWLDANINTSEDGAKSSSFTVTYADGLRYNLGEGWYEFKCDCPIRTSADCSKESKEEDEIALPEALAKLDLDGNTRTREKVVRSYLINPRGGDLQNLVGGEGQQELDSFVGAVSALYARMVGGESAILLLQAMAKKQHIYTNGFATSCACLQ